MTIAAIKDTARDARSLALSLNTDFANVQTYAEQGNAPLVDALMETIDAKMAQLAQYQREINAAAGRRGQIIEHRRA